jgi:hypothetical protein
LVALVAFVAVVAFTARLATSAKGTWPSLLSSIWAPVNVFAFASAPVIALFLIFGLVTALFLSCAVPTLFFGRVAAHATPPMAMNTAIVDMTFA